MAVDGRTAVTESIYPPTLRREEATDQQPATLSCGVATLRREEATDQQPRLGGKIVPQNVYLLIEGMKPLAGECRRRLVG